MAGNDQAGTLALIADPTGPIQWLYLIDTKQKSFALYRIDPMNPKGSVKLEASRKYRWDLELDEYNNQGLEPSDVEARVESPDPYNPIETGDRRRDGSGSSL